MSCIIIDDEPLALELLEDFISNISFLNLVASCSNGFEATNILHEQKIDLIFTDIEMPNFSGIDIIKSLEYTPHFIFTTAYSQYAVEGFNLNAIDYLVKPIPYHRFLKAAKRAHGLITDKQPVNTTTIINKPVTNLEPFIFVKSEYENIKVNINDIKYIEGLKDYIKIHTKAAKPILTLNSLKNFEEKLSQENFIRVHKSYIVSINHIQSVQRNRIIIDDKWIPIGISYKNDFIKRIDG
ncbi:LytTR family DNA-binding domain-containing protein [Tamlana sp. PT2-4]|uniref:LytTR family DNA-binding domain-containing protein n=1 Tax=Neotamlana laminarinivorans TaxID=2883124 RepID=A0A9X1L1N1_9FLAO|nr:LytTR family DNA-binding domain-containing protein [Tamlana laminarinivorans]